jgi:transposase
MFLKVYNSIEIRKALDCYDRVNSFRKAAKISGISKSTIQRWHVTFYKLMTQRSRYQVKKRRCKRRRKYPLLVQEIKDLFANRKAPCFTLKEISKQIVGPSISWIHQCLKHSRISRRQFKFLSKVSSCQEKIDEKARIFKERMDHLLDHEIVCIDETGFCNIGNTMYGYFTKGKEPLSISFRKREKQSVLMGIHPQIGVVNYTSQTKPYNTESFYNFLNDKLIPSLPKNTKAILMDNVSFHRSKRVLELLESHSLTPLFIPPYSPRCNPIEEVFSSLKRFFRDHYFCKEQTFSSSIDQALEDLIAYPNFQSHYNHTRHYIDSKV